MSGKILSFRDLEVYKIAFILQQEIFEISKGFPKEELYSLTDQVRRSSRSIGGEIAGSDPGKFLFLQVMLTEI
jgi:hypothetical protein